MVQIGHGNASTLPKGDRQVKELRSTQRVDYPPYDLQPRQPNKTASESFASHFNLGREQTLYQPVSTAKAEFRAHPVQVGTEKEDRRTTLRNLYKSSLADGERRHTHYKTTAQDNYTGVQPAPAAKPDKALMMQSNFQIGMTSGDRVAQATTAKDAYAQPVDSAYVRKVERDLNTSSIPMGDRAKAGMLVSSNRVDYANPETKPRESNSDEAIQFLRGTHFSLGDDPRSAQQSTTRASYQPVAGAGVPVKHNIDLQMSHIPQGFRSGFMDIYETTQKASFEDKTGSMAQARATYDPQQRTNWLKTNFEVGDNAHLPPLATTTQSDFRQPADAPRRAQPSVQWNSSSIPAGDKRGANYVTTQRLDYENFGADAKPGQPLQSLEYLKSTHFSLGTDPTVTLQSEAHRQFSQPIRSGPPQKPRLDLYSSSIPQGDPGKEATRESTAKSSFANPGPPTKIHAARDPEWFRGSHFEFGNDAPVRGTEYRDRFRQERRKK